LRATVAASRRCRSAAIVASTVVTGQRRPRGAARALGPPARALGPIEPHEDRLRGDQEKKAGTTALRLGPHHPGV